MTLVSLIDHINSGPIVLCLRLFSTHTVSGVGCSGCVNKKRNAIYASCPQKSSSLEPKDGPFVQNTVSFLLLALTR